MITKMDCDLHKLPLAPLPVVLVGGINLVRAIGLTGIPAIVANSDPDELAFHSRYCIYHFLLPSLGKGQAVASALIHLGERLVDIYGQRLPLIYGSDDTLQLISDHRERLRSYFLFLLSDPEISRSLIAKDRFHILAQSRGLPVPASFAWDGDGPGTVRGAVGRVLVKPKVKFNGHHSLVFQRLFSGGKARIFASGTDAWSEPAVALYHNALTFQQYIPGANADLWSYHGFADERSEVIVSFVGRKIRTYPTLTGESAFIELAQEESLASLGREVARRCCLKGVFKMDFKREASSGRWYLLEINNRFNLWHYVAARNGVNLVRVSYDYLVSGVRTRQVTYETGHRWLALDLDFKAYRALASSGETTSARWLASILFSRKVYNIFSWTDPAPWLWLWSRRVRRRLHMLSAKIMALRP